MTFGGAPDFQIQNGPTQTLLGTIAVNVGGGIQTLDLTPFLQPMHMALQLVWVWDGVSLNFRVDTQVVDPGNNCTFLDWSTLDTGQHVSCYIPGQYVLQGGAQAVKVNVTAHNTAPNAVGTLFVFATTQSPVVTPQHRGADQGQLHGDGTVNVLATSQAIVLPGVQGYYYRIRTLSMNYAAVPAAAARCSWVDPSTAQAFYHRIMPAAANSNWDLAVDITTRSGLSFSNQLSITVATIVGYELWPV